MLKIIFYIFLRSIFLRRETLLSSNIGNSLLSQLLIQLFLYDVLAKHIEWHGLILSNQECFFGRRLSTLHPRDVRMKIRIITILFFNPSGTAILVDKELDLIFILRIGYFIVNYLRQLWTDHRILIPLSISLRNVLGSRNI